MKIMSKTMALLLSLSMAFSGIVWLGAGEVSAADGTEENASAAVSTQEVQTKKAIDFAAMSASEWESYGIKELGHNMKDVIVDVRAKANYDKAHLYGARSAEVTASSVPAASAEVLDKAFVDAKANGGRVVIVCNTGNSLAKSAMQYLYNNHSDASKENAVYLIGGAAKLGPFKGEAKKRTMEITVDMTKYPKGETVKVWVPLPTGDENQSITKISYMAYKPKAVKRTKIVTDGFTNRMFYVEWDKNAAPSDRMAYFRYDASRVEVGNNNVLVSTDETIPAEAMAYINKESQYVKVNDPVIKNQVKKIFDEFKAQSGIEPKTTYEKAFAIYRWVYQNLERIDNGETLTNSRGETKKFEIIGCGYGDTVKIISDFNSFGRAGGHCTDINSTFVALCRAAGVPAREMFGIRMNDDATGGQHCWAEYYQPGSGWVYADPGDALKAVKGNNKEMTLDAVAKAKKSTDNLKKFTYFFGSVDNNRVILSRGRDLTLSPAQSNSNGVYNTFGYPCAEHNGKRIECTDAANFKYTIVSKATGTAPAFEKGDVVTVGGNTYKITSAVKMTAGLVKAKNAKNVAAPGSFRINGRRVAVTKVYAKAFRASKIRKVTLGANVKTLAKNAFYGSKATKIVAKTKLMTKSSVAGSLRGSKVKTVQVKAGSQSVNKKYAKKYANYFTKKNAGRKATVK